MPIFPTLAEAAVALGYASPDALRVAFKRRLIPARFLLRIGDRTLRVDLERLVAFYREQADAEDQVRNK